VGWCIVGTCRHTCAGLGSPCIGTTILTLFADKAEPLIDYRRAIRESSPPYVHSSEHILVGDVFGHRELAHHLFRDSCNHSVSIRGQKRGTHDARGIWRRIPRIYEKEWPILPSEIQESERRRSSSAVDVKQTIVRQATVGESCTLCYQTYESRNRIRLAFSEPLEFWRAESFEE
jgi:hypothetical protein